MPPVESAGGDERRHGRVVRPGGGVGEAALRVVAKDVGRAEVRDEIQVAAVERDPRVRRRTGAGVGEGEEGPAAGIVERAVDPIRRIIGACPPPSSRGRSTYFRGCWPRSRRRPARSARRRASWQRPSSPCPSSHPPSPQRRRSRRPPCRGGDRRACSRSPRRAGERKEKGALACALSLARALMAKPPCFRSPSRRLTA